MMSSNMEKIMSYIFAIGAAILCLVMVFFEVINQNIPMFFWLAFSMILFVNAVRFHKKEEQTF